MEPHQNSFTQQPPVAIATRRIAPSRLEESNILGPGQINSRKVGLKLYSFYDFSLSRIKKDLAENLALVREGGLEPPRGIAPPDPKSGASTNSATPAEG